MYWLLLINYKEYLFAGWESAEFTIRPYFMFNLGSLRLSFVVMNNQTALLELVEVLDGDVKNPIERHAIFIIVELILSIDGILIMNIFIACIIIFSKSLRTKPRNTDSIGPGTFQSVSLFCSSFYGIFSFHFR